MSSLLAHLAYDRIDRARLFFTYFVGLGAGVVLAVVVLTAIGVFSVP